jgi:hypothetical protein
MFATEWQDRWSLLKKPVENRALWSPSSRNAQGKLRMWVDILTPDEAARNPPVPLAPPPKLPVELRVIIYKAKDVVFKDANMSDIKVSVYPHGNKPQFTDTVRSFCCIIFYFWI